MPAATFSFLPADGGHTLSIEGDWSSLSIGDEALGLDDAMADVRGPTRLDLSRAGRIDTAGTYLILRATGAALAPSAMPQETEKLFTLVRPVVESQAEPSSGSSGLVQFFTSIGHKLALVGTEIAGASVFAGHTWSEIARSARSPGNLRIMSLVHMMEVAGVNALPIVILLNFFIGAVVALVGASLLADLGFSVMTVQLVGVAVLREFAVLFTGILLAGRSASAFAAQIGSMKMAQEIDAMRVIGVDPYQALVLPRILALMLMMPVQIFAGMAAGITGGLLICWAALDMSPIFFLTRLHDTVSVRHFWVGMSKAPLMAVLIAMAGCRHGLFVGGDVESLGSRVTSAVVQGIVVVILFDALFAIAFMELHL